MKRFKQYLSQRFLKLTKPGSSGWEFIHCSIILYAGVMVAFAGILLLAVAFSPVSKAQSQGHGSYDGLRIDELEHRVAALEGLRIGERLAVIEVLAKETNANSYWGPVSMGGIGLLIFREAFKALRQKAMKDDDDDEDI